jgi:hypothetical protein
MIIPFMGVHNRLDADEWSQQQERKEKFLP